MTFSDLHDAFAELEHRADTAGDLVGAPAPGRPRRRHPSRPGRTGATVAAVLASAAAVAAVAVGISFTSGGGSHHVAVVGSTPSQSITAPVQSSATASTVSAATLPPVPATDVPTTQAALIARFRSILGDTATFTVDTANSTDNLITGVLTSTAGTRGMYVLGLDKNAALCGTLARVGQTPTLQPCPNVTTLADGSQLKVDPNFPDGPPNGLMNDAILNRPDGWQISLYTANVQGKYLGAPVLGTEPALTVQQVTDIVTSTQWLAN